MIDIDHFVPPDNATRIHYSTRVAPEPTVFFEQQDDSPPPPYSVQYVELCNRCSVSRQDLTPKFCSSCGQSFDRYDRYDRY